MKKRKKNNKPLIILIVGLLISGSLLGFSVYKISENKEYVLKYQEPINVYLRALGLETISSEDRFWCVDTATGWITGWKRFRWDVTTALNALNDQFRIRTPNGYIALPYYPDTAKLFVLLKGWEHLFVEV